MRAITGLALALSLAVAATAWADWPRFMGPDGTGIAPAAEKISKTFPAGGPKELWHFVMAGGFASPAVVGNKVYLLDRPGGAAKEVFRVLDLATGKEDWSVENESQAFKDNYGVTRGTPAVERTMAYTVGVTGDLLAIDLTARKIAWKKNLGKDFGAKAGGWGFATSPVVLGDKVIVDASGSKTVGVIALDKKTGAQIWASPAFGAPNTYTTPVLVTIDQVEQLLAWHTGAVAGIGPADGKLLWKYDWRTAAAIPDPVYLGNGRIYLTTGYGTGCAKVEVKAGDQGFAVKEVFKNNRSGSKVSNAIFYKGYIYTNASDRDQGLQCLDPDGNIKWTSKQHFGLGSMIIADDTIVMMSSKDGTLFLIEATPDGYKELGKAKVLETSDVFAPLVLSGGKLLVRDQKTLKCLDVCAK